MQPRACVRVKKNEKDLLHLKQLLEAGAIQPVIDRAYPLEQIADAHRYVDTGRKKGNVVIAVVAEQEQVYA